MDGECMNCGESGNWCRCDEEPQVSQPVVAPPEHVPIDANQFFYVSAILPKFVGEPIPDEALQACAKRMAKSIDEMILQRLREPPPVTSPEESLNVPSLDHLQPNLEKFLDAQSKRAMNDVLGLLTKKPPPVTGDLEGAQ